jgi:hypothetical protein
MGSTQAALGEPFFGSHKLEDQFERLSICGINACGVDSSSLQRFEAKNTNTRIEYSKVIP